MSSQLSVVFDIALAAVTLLYLVRLIQFAWRPSLDEFAIEKRSLLNQHVAPLRRARC